MSKDYKKLERDQIKNIKQIAKLEDKAEKDRIIALVLNDLKFV